MCILAYLYHKVCKAWSQELESKMQLGISCRTARRSYSLSQEWQERKCFSQPQFSTDHAHLFTSGPAYTMGNTLRVSVRSDNFGFLAKILPHSSTPGFWSTGMGPRSTGLCPWTTGLGPRSTWLGPRTTGLGPRSTGFGSKSCRIARRLDSGQTINLAVTFK